MATIKFECESTYALLMHNPASMVAGDTGKLGQKKIPKAEDEAERGAYRLPDRRLFLKSVSFRNACIDALKGRRIGRQSASAIFGSCVFPTHETCPLFNGDGPLKDFEIDVQRVVVQKAGIMRARPRIPHWKTEIEFEFDPDFINEGIIEEGLKIAGKIVGVGDFRPRPPMGGGKGGPYGRFAVKRI